MLVSSRLCMRPGIGSVWMGYLALICDWVSLWISTMSDSKMIAMSWCSSLWAGWQGLENRFALTGC